MGIDSRSIHRRGLVAGIGALVTTALAHWTAQPAQAGVDGDLVLNTSNQGTALTTLQSLPAGSSGYTVLKVENLRIADALEAKGSPGSLGNAGRRGVVATGGDNIAGTFALPSNGGDAILATGGSAASGVGSGGRGIRAVGGSGGSFSGGTGVEGTGGAPFGIGVRGFGGGTNGSQGAGVSGTTNSGTNAAVQGTNLGTGPGVQGQSESGTGVQGSGGSAGVSGETTSGNGVMGTSVSGTGVQGQSISGDGILGFSSGDLKYSLAGSGSGQAHGLIGYSQNPFGVSGINQNGNNWAGAFFNAGATAPNSGAKGLFVQGDFLVLNGTKNAAVKTQRFGHRKMYAVEATENVFEDFGTATLKGGKARVDLDEMFAETVNTGQKYQVFMTPRGDSKGLFVSAQDARGFTVQESQNGTGSYDFDFRVVAKVRGYEKTRMEQFEPPPLPKMPEPPVDLPKPTDVKEDKRERP
jgi:hypothetical protein